MKKKMSWKINSEKITAVCSLASREEMCEGSFQWSMQLSILSFFSSENKVRTLLWLFSFSERLSKLLMLLCVGVCVCWLNDVLNFREFTFVKWPS